MKKSVCLTGWGGYLAYCLMQTSQVPWRWTRGPENTDALFLLGGPTYTSLTEEPDERSVMEKYYNDTVELINGYNERIIFASTTGVNDPVLKPYTEVKYRLEQYIIEHCQDYLILRIGSIISDDQRHISIMKPDRIQPRMQRGDYTGIKFTDHYLHTNTFVEETLIAINSGRQGIMDYSLQPLTLLELRKMTLK